MKAAYGGISVMRLIMKTLKAAVTATVPVVQLFLYLVFAVRPLQQMIYPVAALLVATAPINLPAREIIRGRTVILSVHLLAADH